MQNVQQTAENQGVTMTVLQAFGDTSTLYMTLRFDFPKTVLVHEDLDFKDIHILQDGKQPFSYSRDVVERTETSATYLFHLHNSAVDLNGRPLTITFSDYGRPIYEEEDDSIMLHAEEPKTVMISPDGRSINSTATAGDVAALTAAVARKEQTDDGFTLTYYGDGTIVVHYDGLHGLRYITVYLDHEAPEVRVGDDPTFETVLAGKWEQSWTVAYEDLSLRWSGDILLFGSEFLNITEFCLSPLSWQASFRPSDYQWLSLPEEWTAQLVHEDGTVTELPMRRTSMRSTDDITVAGSTFDTPLDLAGVTAIVINGVELPLT